VRVEFRSFEDRPVFEYSSEAGHVVVHHFFGAASPEPERAHTADGPEAFLVEVDEPTFHERAHFHDVDQFQVFFGVPGAYFGRTPVSRLMFQYADAYSTYGPFGSPDPGLRFYTLRPGPSSIRAYMPDDRDKLVRRGRRQQIVDVDAELDRPIDRPSVTQVLGGDAADPSAAVAAIPAGTAVDVPAPVTSQGQYCCVLEGCVEVDGDRFGLGSLGWRPPAAPGAEPTSLRSAAGSRARVLVVQFPPATTDDGC
jgi:hypothetical protein